MWAKNVEPPLNRSSIDWVLLKGTRLRSANLMKMMSCGSVGRKLVGMHLFQTLQGWFGTVFAGRGTKTGTVGFAASLFSVAFHFISTGSTIDHRAFGLDSDKRPRAGFFNRSNEE